MIHVHLTGFYVNFLSVLSTADWLKRKTATVAYNKQTGFSFYKICTATELSNLRLNNIYMENRALRTQPLVDYCMGKRCTINGHSGEPFLHVGYPTGLRGPRMNRTWIGPAVRGVQCRGLAMLVISSDELATKWLIINTNEDLTLKMKHVEKREDKIELKDIIIVA